MSAYTMKTFAERADRMDDNWRLVDEGWAEFMKHDPVGDPYFPRLYPEFADFQFMLYDGETVVATCNSIPVTWDLRDETLPDAGWDWALSRGFEVRDQGIVPTVLSALGITVAREYLGKGVSSQALRAMKQSAERHGMNALVAPVRPTLKASYPLTPMERYITWTREDGAPFDPWLRTHWRVGARIVKVAPLSMTVPGTVAQWEDWAKMQFPESGEYVVPGALNPVTVDIEHDRIIYVEPNVWMVHPVDADRIESS
jgi:hypothetical protein